MDATRALLFGETEEKKKVDIWGSSSKTDEESDFFSETSESRKDIFNIKSTINTKKTTEKEIQSPLHANSAPILSLSNDEQIHNEIKDEETEEFHDPLLNPLSCSNHHVIQKETEPIIKPLQTEVIQEHKKEKAIVQHKLFEVFIVVGTPVCKNVSATLITSQIQPQILFQYPKQCKLPLQKVCKTKRYF